MRYLTLFIVGFVVFCGWLVAESGLDYRLCGNDKEVIEQGCILLQQTAAVEKPQAETTPFDSENHQELTAVSAFKAFGGPEENVSLGSIDPNSGFKFQLELSTKGAAIVKATFSEFDDRDYKDPKPLVILSPVKTADGDEILSMANKELVFVQEGLQLSLQNLHWRSLGKETSDYGSQSAGFEAVIKTLDAEPVLKLVKTYKLRPGSYLLDCELSVENLSGEELEYHFNLVGPIGIGQEDVRTDMRKIVGGFRISDGGIVSTRRVILTSFFGKMFRGTLGLKDATLQYEQARSLADREQAKKHLQINYKKGGAQFLWAAITNKYFAAILRPEPDKGKDYCDWLADKLGWFYDPDGEANSGDETIGLNLKIAPHTLAPFSRGDSSRAYSFQLYLGPKDKERFTDTEEELGQKLGLIQTIDFMTCCCPVALIRPISFGILALMKWMYGFIHNYGIVIIILVFLLRIAIHPLTKSSQVSMSKFQRVMSTPEAQQIKKKYAGNVSEQQKQMMELYKKHGVSPATQMTMMLPMFVQMPVWISLWTAINTSIDVRGKAFLPFWITDLSAPDALFRFTAINLPLFGKIDSFNLLPILMGVAFYLQQKLMPSQAGASMDPKVAQQQKLFKVMMVLLFPLLLYKGPSGVNLYIMSSVFAGVVEQYFIRKHIREKEQTESIGKVAVTSKTGGKVKKKKPKPFYKI